MTITTFFLPPFPPQANAPIIAPKLLSELVTSLPGATSIKLAQRACHVASRLFHSWPDQFAVEGDGSAEHEDKLRDIVQELQDAYNTLRCVAFTLLLLLLLLFRCAVGVLRWLCVVVACCLLSAHIRRGVVSPACLSSRHRAIHSPAPLPDIRTRSLVRWEVVGVPLPHVQSLLELVLSARSTFPERPLGEGEEDPEKDIPEEVVQAYKVAGGGVWGNRSVV